MTAMATSPFDITGARALVTGSSKGIGKALARALVEAGADVILNARTAQALERTREELADAGPGPVRIAAFDVTDEDQVRDGLARVGPIDILVNNAGMQRRAPLTDFATADFDAVMTTNVRSVFLVTREAARGMIERGRGKVIVIASVQSELARPGIAPYSASKGAVRMLVKGMCADLATAGICVNAIAPGYFATELTSALVADEDFTSWVQARTPAGRWGRVEDLTGTLLWLASPASDFVNGQTIFVDGGMTAVL